MLKAIYSHHNLKFIIPGGTSRGVLNSKISWYIKLCHESIPNVIGVGECSLLPGLSIDDIPEFENKLHQVCDNINDYTNSIHEQLKDWPSIRFGLEQAFLDLKNGGERIIYPSDFTAGKKTIPINGLIWMGDVSYMKQQLKQKLKDGFNCIKMKVGAIDFEQELNILKEIRNQYSSQELELRVDANGAFNTDDVLVKLEKYKELEIHSIEQPIKAGQIKQMAKLCKDTPLPVALDEELIGINNFEEKESLISEILPQYIILKPSLLGGFKASEEWISIANKYKVGWWVTSALEGNIGLNAIAQWTAMQNNNLPQGLGTGQVFSNNIASPLNVKNGNLSYNSTTKWAKVL